MPERCLDPLNIRVGAQAGDAHTPFSAQVIEQRGRGLAKARQGLPKALGTLFAFRVVFAGGGLFVGFFGFS